MAKLNQVIAVEKAVKTRVNTEVNALYHLLQKPALFDGFNKVYKPTVEDEQVQPPQVQKVQHTVGGVLLVVQDRLRQLFDVAAQKDFANLDARADIVIEGEVVASRVPTTFLLFLEKQLTDLYTLVEKVPTLDPAAEWTYDSVKSLYRTEPQQAFKTRKVQKPLVLYPATDKHPAQTQVITEDVNVGTWELVRLSGATTETEKKTLLGRIATAQRAVKFAREQANVAEAPEQDAGAKILDWIF